MFELDSLVRFDESPHEVVCLKGNFFSSDAECAQSFDALDPIDTMHDGPQAPLDVVAV